jgi:hypothetical protein
LLTILALVNGAVPPKAKVTTQPAKAVSTALGYVQRKVVLIVCLGSVILNSNLFSFQLFFVFRKNQ